MNERIKKLRKALDLTQQEFGERINLKQNTIALIEGGRNTSEQTISAICREFNVSETWLRTGEGEMFHQLDDEQELADLFAAIAVSDDDLIKRIIKAYWQLDEKEKAAIRKLIDGLSGQ